ncbi:uncharacterized protein LOC116209701 isoform X2 [Punica granatum]|uniref:Uncharacterized protein LOC116209701 isoform X2 n=1 Tax=Punica granatum TaxID=22663 RepID=A0A6P8E327_PUNGR|nr:uncharacterized protein LOC116209701 isoform X2 [Punica granatum]
MSHTSRSFGSSVNTFITMIMMILCIAFCLLGANSVAAAQEDVLNPETPISREDLVKIAGYGEDKLSTVLITGSVLCDEAAGRLNDNGDDEARTLPRPQPVSGQ